MRKAEWRGRRGRREGRVWVVERWVSGREFMEGGPVGAVW